MGLSIPVAAVLIVLVTVVPMLLIAGFTARFISRNFRDAAGIIEPRPARRWFGLRRLKSADSTTASLATHTQHYADSWPDLESLRTYRDTPNPSIQHGIHEIASCESPAPQQATTTVQIQQPTETWHPSRASRLSWSFSPTRRRTDRGGPLPKSRSRSKFSRDSGVVLEGGSEEMQAARDQLPRLTRG
ncbi:hypothetical protein BDP55DRAFT_600049 [Colletotrichum godetiae]|uniref:Uncharacterized protein n=1 Tax=Colletotrichum godetiae TaxID=1209918 RepID=A0AAJ0AYL1_9PEZI|nr:uncharacterized protein BDP55DRAFT_600049 [Colletotrichum godetiae]KAK1699875.1 hypothetical protein BDP55DRAFT_600049 [Colletotrichum godetiae]